MTAILDPFALKADGGLLTLDGSQAGWTQVGDTLQCRHCAMHWQRIPGSGRRRGFCMRCYGPTCGKPECDNCFPYEKWMEEVEREWR